MGEEIEERIRKFLEEGRIKLNEALRYEVLSIFSSGKEYTTREIYRILLSKGMDISYRSLCAFIGSLPIHLGIFSIRVSDVKYYRVKPQYLETLRKVLSQWSFCRINENNIPHDHSSNL